jgi:hypothetical protein
VVCLSLACDANSGWKWCGRQEHPRRCRKQQSFDVSPFHHWYRKVTLVISGTALRSRNGLEVSWAELGALSQPQANRCSSPERDRTCICSPAADGNSVSAGLGSQAHHICLYFGLAMLFFFLASASYPIISTSCKYCPICSPSCSVTPGATLRSHPPIRPAISL